jgi:tetratricopeptide (TPR) repeat protein
VDFLKRLWQDNPWIPPVVGALGVASTFFLGGVIPGLVGVFLLMLIIIAAQANSLRKAVGPKPADEGRTPQIDLPTSEVDEDGPRPQEGDPEVGRQTSPDEAAGPNVDPGAKEPVDIRAAFVAAVAQRPDDVRAITDPWIEKATDEDERIERVSIQLSLLVRAGETSHIEDLRALVNTHPSSSAPLNNLAIALDETGESAEAARVIRSGRPKAAKNQGFLAAREAQLYRKIGNHREALSAANEAIALGGPSSVMADAYEEKGRALRALGKDLEGLAWLDRAVVEQPSRDKTRFDLAYAYSAAGFSELALLHYQILVRGETKLPNAYNNYGVVLRDFGLKLRAGKQYKTALTRGSSLAGANLAAIAVVAGLDEEADTWLQQAEAAEDDQNAKVGEERARLAKDRESEDELLEEVTERAHDLRKSFRAFSRAVTDDLPTGRWKLSTGVELDLMLQGDGSVLGSSPEGSITLVLERGEEAPLLDARLSDPGAPSHDAAGVVAYDGNEFLGFLEDYPQRGRKGLISGRPAS